MWKLILITSAITSQVIDSGDDVALRAHLANLVRLDRERVRERARAAAAEADDATLAPAFMRTHRPKLDGDGEVVFSNGTRCVLRFDPKATAQTEIPDNVVPFANAA